MQRIYLKQGRERPVQNGHPWVFSGAIERIEGAQDDIGVADVFDCKKTWLARGLYNPRSQIRLRLLTWQKEEIDSEFFTRRLSTAQAFRKRHLAASTNAYRIVNAEGDFLPGLIVDRYA
ncbi:MAG: 23S rRNA (cytosine(1962)-C(5))-methyltransferase RlmI, partial [Candidatus Binatia bacterium]